MRVILGKGFIGSALQKRLNCRIVSHQEADLTKPLDALSAVSGAEVVYLCAGKTGGVGRMSSDPMSFVYPNVRIHMGVFEACVKAGVKRVVCVGSTTGYPDSGDAMTEDRYLEGDLHPAYFVPGNAHRFIKRLAMMHKDLETVFFRPSNVYGPGNNFDPQNSHVIEATIRKVAERQNPFVIWGTGNEVRDAIYIDDLAEAMTYGETCAPGDYNVGSGEEMSVNHIAASLRQYVNLLGEDAGVKYNPDIIHDLSKPTAIPARRVNCDKLKSLGWRPRVSMKEGLRKTYDWYTEHKGAI
jgi:GDP-L-fucose synthase